MNKLIRISTYTLWLEYSPSTCIQGSPLKTLFSDFFPVPKEGVVTSSPAPKLRKGKAEFDLDK